MGLAVSPGDRNPVSGAATEWSPWYGLNVVFKDAWVQYQCSIGLQACVAASQKLAFQWKRAARQGADELFPVQFLAWAG